MPARRRRSLIATAKKYSEPQGKNVWKSKSIRYLFAAVGPSLESAVVCMGYPHFSYLCAARCPEMGLSPTLSALTRKGPMVGTDWGRGTTEDG